LLDGDLVLTGYVDSYAPRFDADTHVVEIRGRSRTADFVDSSAVVPGGQMKGLSLLDVALRLAAPFGLAVEVLSALGPVLPDVQIQQGETCYAVVERLCRMQGLLVCDGPGGALALARAGTRRAQGALIQGVNLLSASAELDQSRRHSEYIVKGQRPNTDDRGDGPAPAAGRGLLEQLTGDGGGAGATVRACLGRALDVAVGRYRPLILIAETQTDDASAFRRALWEARRRLALGVKASVLVQGWRQQPGAAGSPLWDVNLLVPVVSDWLGIDREMLISAVEFRKDDGGTTTALELTLPDAFQGADETAPGGSASGGAAGGNDDLWSGGWVKGTIERGLGVFG
jgi:prophage tail gpP-like protein